jgi:hypothetical protein
LGLKGTAVVQRDVGDEAPKARFGQSRIRHPIRNEVITVISGFTLPGWVTNFFANGIGIEGNGRDVLGHLRAIIKGKGEAGFIKGEVAAD